jgi:tRNA nucleotidyltransferase (CCA-adding enzyme)
MTECYVWTEYPFAARLHDIGKLFTQKFDEDGVAHYYQHENVGCYYLLSNLESIKRHRDYSDEELLNILFLVNYHMMPMSWDSDKASQKWLRRFGEYKYKLLLDFNKCDKAR